MQNPGDSGKLHGGETSVFYQVTEEMAEATRKLQSPVKTFSWESEEREEGREEGRERNEKMPRKRKVWKTQNNCHRQKKQRAL